MPRNAAHEQAPPRLSDEHRAEWNRLEGTSRAGGALDGWVTFGSLVASAILALAALSSMSEPLFGQFIVLCVATVIVFFGGHAIGQRLHRRAIAKAEARMRELRELARTSPVSRFRPDQSGGHSNDYNDDTDWAKYPVTGTHNPELYRARGGRETATGMATWGVDYETYRSNIE